MAVKRASALPSSITRFRAGEAPCALCGAMPIKALPFGRGFDGGVAAAARLGETADDACHGRRVSPRRLYDLGLEGMPSGVARGIVRGGALALTTWSGWGTEAGVRGLLWCAASRSNEPRSNSAPLPLCECAMPPLKSPGPPCEFSAILRCASCHELETQNGDGGGSSGGRATLCVRITEPGESNLSRRVGEEASSRPEDGRGVVGSPNRSADERRASGVCAAIPRRGER